MMWVLRKRKDTKSKLLKYKARAVVCGNQQKRKAQESGTKGILEIFSPSAARLTTFKLLCAVGGIANLRIGQCAVDTAYLQGQFKEGDDEEIYIRPPPAKHNYDNRGAPIVWKLLKPLYGESDAGHIWHRLDEQ
eukprot:2580923-Pleurochrysis_carterae.AAC.2